MCGILGGNGKASKGMYRGIAPDCEFLVGKVLDHNGNGNLEELEEAIHWVLEKRESYHIRILNISIGMEKEDDEKEYRIKNLIRQAWEEGIAVVVSAGNSGPAPMSISSLGEIAEIITVGCHDKDFVASNGKSCQSYSSRGPGLEAIRKPDLVAPGTEIISCDRHEKTVLGKHVHAYCPKSGTSMATPVVAGALALLLEKRPELTNTDLKKILIHSTDDLQLPWHIQGNGFLNLKNAMNFLVWY